MDQNWLSKRKPSLVVINGTASGWASVISGVPQGSVLEPVLFIMYINDIDVGLNNFISRFADDAIIGNSIIDDRDRKIRENFHEGLKGEKCPVMSTNVTFYMWVQEIKIYYEMNCIKLNSIQCVNDLGFSIASNLKFSQQCKDAAGKANGDAGLYKQDFLLHE